MVGLTLHELDIPVEARTEEINLRLLSGPGATHTVIQADTTPEAAESGFIEHIPGGWWTVVGGIGIGIGILYHKVIAPAWRKTRQEHRAKDRVIGNPRS